MIDTRKMTLPDILKDIQSILEKDCAAAELLPRDHTADIFLRAVSTMEEMHMLEDRAFHNFVQIFVSSRKLPYVFFHMMDGGDFKNYWRGIAVQERGGVLYVTNAIPESGFKSGDRIVSLNSQDPAVFYNRNIMRPEDSPLAGDEDWQAFLNHGILASVVHMDGSEPVKIRFSECCWRGRDPWEDPTQSFGEEAIQPKVERLPSGTLYMRIPNFGNEEEIEAAVLEMRVKRGDAATLILDLRGCRGGSPEYLQPLLPYLCDGPMSRDAFFGKVRELTRFTERNCELFREQMQPFLTGTDEDLKEMARERMAEIESHQGQDYAETEEEFLERGGWIPEPDSPFEEVRILVDERTAGEAEWLATRAKRQKKVRIFGRRSSGEMDYASPVIMRYAYGAMLRYPASRLVFGSDDEAGSTRVIPDVEIPWTPQELNRDVILDAAQA